MAITKKVLLARPHSFIVSEMRPFLEKNGFAPTKLENLQALETGNLGTFSGAVISTAVVSAVNASAEEIFAALRKRYPKLPVLFAGLTEFPVMKSAIDRVVKNLHPDAEILPFATTTETHPGLGRENIFLVLKKEDLAASAELTERILRKHFR